MMLFSYIAYCHEDVYSLFSDECCNYQYKLVRIISGEPIIDLMLSKSHIEGPERFSAQGYIYGNLDGSGQLDGDRFDTDIKKSLNILSEEGVALDVEYFTDVASNIESEESEKETCKFFDY